MCSIRKRVRLSLPSKAGAPPCPFQTRFDHGVDGVVDRSWLLDVVRRTLMTPSTIGAMTDLAVAFGQAHEVVAVGVRLNARRQRRRVERCAVIEHRRRRPPVGSPSTSLRRERGLRGDRPWVERLHLDRLVNDLVLRLLACRDESQGDRALQSASH